MAVQEAMLEMEGMAAMCCDAIAEGLQGVKEAPQEMRRAFRAACRVVTIIIPTAEKCVTLAPSVQHGCQKAKCCSPAQVAGVASPGRGTFTPSTPRVAGRAP